MFNVSALHAELVFKAVRSSGKGGQHVNKVATKVELYFDVAGSSLLQDDQKKLLREKLANRISKDGWLMIDAQESRSQISNKKIAIAKFDEMIFKAFEKRKIRLKSNPSPAVKARRLETKRKHAEKKRLRGSRFND